MSEIVTFEEIKSSNKDFLYAEDIQNVLDANPNTIRKQAHDNPTALGFPVVVCGTRVRIPRKPFIRVETINAYLEGGYKSLTPEQQNIYNKLGDYIPDYSKNSLVKKRDEYLKKLYGENPLNKNHQNSIINTEFTNGGNNNAERMGETGENPRGNQRVQRASGKLHTGREGIRTDDVGRRNPDGRHQVLYRVLNENDYVDAVKRQKADVLELYDYSDDYETFSKALEEGKASNPKGYMVDGKTVEDLGKGSMRSYFFAKKHGASKRCAVFL